MHLAKRPLALALLALFLVAAPPEADACRRRSNLGACFANQKTLMGAVEMYSLDFNTNVEALTPEFLEELRDEGYLQSIPDDPGVGSGSSGNYVILPSHRDPWIACLRHGAIQDEGGLADRPRDLLRRSGIQDPELLARALEERVEDSYGYRSWRPRRGSTWFALRGALKMALRALVPFGGQLGTWLTLAEG